MVEKTDKEFIADCRSYTAKQPCMSGDAHIKELANRLEKTIANLERIPVGITFMAQDLIIPEPPFRRSELAAQVQKVVDQGATAIVVETTSTYYKLVAGINLLKHPDPILFEGEVLQLLPEELKKDEAFDVDILAAEEAIASSRMLLCKISKDLGATLVDGRGNPVPCECQNCAIKK